MPINESFGSDYITICSMYLEIQWLREKLRTARCPKLREEIAVEIMVIESFIVERIEMN